MANAPSQKRKLTKKKPQELNIMPIMNMFLVIIPMLLMLMVTVNLAMLSIDYSASSNPSEANGAGKNKKKKKKDKGFITIKIMMDKIQIDFGIKKKKPINIPMIDEGNGKRYDFLTLDEKLAELKKSEKYKEEKNIFVLTEPDIYYDTLIKTIDLCKQNGFSNVRYISTRRILLKKK